MEGPSGYTDKAIGPDTVRAEDVRSLPLHDITQKYGTLGLFVRLEDTLARTELDNAPEVQWAVHFGLMLHAGDSRTNGPYEDHLLRSTIRLVDHFGITDPEIVAAVPLHDGVEDHAKDIVRILGEEEIEDEVVAREQALCLLGQYISARSVDLIRGVTNPLTEDGEDSGGAYLKHFQTVILPDPRKRVLKLVDFTDNGPGNHYTKGEKQLHLDRKYEPLYKLHVMGLFMPDSLIVGEQRERAARQLIMARARALARLSLASPQ